MKLQEKQWNKTKYQEYIKYLKSLSDKEYQKFSQKLTPTKTELLGVRVPILRKIAKEISKGNSLSFLKYTQTNYLEEIMIEGLVITNLELEQDFLNYFNKFINKIDNWEVNDIFCTSLKRMKKDELLYFPILLKLAYSYEEFKVRVGLIGILSNFVKEDKLPEIFKLLDNLNNEDYYSSMGAAWLLCECYIKYPELTKKYMLNSKLKKDTFNKAIQKMRDSFRVDKDDKNFWFNHKK